jgi:branched chain amino acid efflux pump
VSAWIGRTALGALLGDRLPSPDALGLDAVFPALYLPLLYREAAGRRAKLVIAMAALVALALVPLGAAGVPIIVASLAALVGLRRQ